MRTRITLECTECKNRNYNMTKDKKTHPDRMETKKYCKFCKSHTAQRNEIIVGRKWMYEWKDRKSRKSSEVKLV